MAEVMDRRGAGGERDDQVATEIPSRNLPGLPYRDLPEPVPLRRIIGPGVIILAAAIGSATMNTSLAPAPIAESRTARRSTSVMPEGTQTITFGLTRNTCLSMIVFRK